MKMSSTRARHRSFLWSTCLAVAVCAPHFLAADTFHWIGQTDDNWNVGTNWSVPPCGQLICGNFPPGSDDDAIVKPTIYGSSIYLSDDVEVQSLDIGDGMHVRTDGFQLDAGGGLVTANSKLHIDGFGSTLVVVGDDTPRDDLLTNQFQLTNGAVMRLVAGAQVDMTDMAPSNIVSNSVLFGNGSLRFRNVLGFPNTVLYNDGAIIPSFGNMTITVENNGRIDLDGAGGQGLVDVDDWDNVTSRNLTLTIDGPLSDNFDGVMLIGKGDRVHFTHPWQLGTPLGQGSRLEMHGRDRAATISGAAMVMDDGLGRIEVRSGTARLESDLSVYAGTLAVSNNTILDFAGDAYFSAAESHIDKSAAVNHEMIVRGNVEIDSTDFDWDGPSGQHTTMILGGELQIDNTIDPNQQFASTVSVISVPHSSAVLRVRTAQSWTSLGTIHLDGTHNTALITGLASLSIGDGTYHAANNAQLIVDGPYAQIDTFLELEDFSEVTLNAGSTLSLMDFAEIEEGVQFAGTGLLENHGTVEFEEGANVTVPFINRAELKWNHSGNSAGYGDVSLAEFEQTSTGEVTMWLRNAALGPSDQINVTSEAHLDGELHVGVDLPLPDQGDEFVLLTASEVMGEFSEVFLPQLDPEDTFRVVYEPTAVLVRVTASGDFNGDESFDCLDVDALVAAIAAGSTDLQFDVTGDGDVNGNDLDQWRADAGAEHLDSGNPYLAGDANLDGTVDGADFITWNNYRFTSSAAWCSGDFNADGIVDGLDFVIWNDNRFMTSDAMPVPEPVFGGWILAALLAIARRRPFCLGNPDGCAAHPRRRIGASHHR